MPAMVQLFRSARSHLAVVLDDFGAMAGIVTFEDVLEEIVGEIREQLDIEKGADLRAPGKLHRRRRPSCPCANCEPRRAGTSNKSPARRPSASGRYRNAERLIARGETIRIRDYEVTTLEVHAWTAPPASRVCARTGVRRGISAAVR